MTACWRRTWTWTTSGNRLHAGLRALQHGRRTIIVEIDNRAREMGADFGLPTVGRTDFQRLEQMILAPLELAVKTPHAAIDRWKAQFLEARSRSTETPLV